MATKIKPGYIDDNAVGTAQIADNSITAAKIAAGVLTDQIAGLSSSADATAITIDSSERVGIGTANPVAELNVDGRIVIDDGARSNPTGGASLVLDYQTTSNQEGRIRSRDWDGATWKDLTIEAEDIILNANGDIILDADGTQIILKDNGTEFAQFLTSSTPDHLYIRSMIQDKDIIFSGNDNGSFISALTLDMSNAGEAKFNSDITLSTAGKRLYIARASDGSTTGSIYSPADSDIRISGAGSSAGEIQFEPSSTSGVAMKILSGGAVDIGGSEAAHANTDDLIVGNYSGNHGIQINAQNTGNSSIFFGDNDSVLIGQIEYVHGADYFAFITGLGQRLRVDHQGIKFNSDTAAANALNDYEEGSFTPSLANTGVSPAPTGAGWYTKIGGLVHVQMYFAGITPTSAGNTRINGMPFAASTPGNAYAVCHYCHGTLLGNNTNGGGYFTGTAIDVISPGSTGYNSWATGSAKYGMWSGSYHTNS